MVNGYLYVCHVLRRTFRACNRNNRLEFHQSHTSIREPLEIP